MRRRMHGLGLLIAVAGLLALLGTLPVAGGALGAPRDASLGSAGDIFVIGVGGDLTRVNPATGAQTVVSRGGNLQITNGITIGADGQLYVTASFCPGCALTRGLIRVDPATGAQAIVADGLPLTVPFGIAAATNGDLILTDRFCCSGTLGGVLRVNPNTGAQTIVAQAPGFLSPVGIAIAANGDLLVTTPNTGAGTAGLLRIDPTTGSRTVVSAGGTFTQPSGIALAASGEIFVADNDCCGGRGGVIRVDPATGAQTIVSQGDRFRDPQGLAFEASGDLIVADRTCCGGNGGVLRVSPATGTQALLVAQSSSFTPPYAVVIAPVLTIDDVTVTEGNGGLTSATFTVSLAPYVGRTVTVQAQTANGSATAGSDYTAVGPLTLTFRPGTSTQTVSVPVIGDFAVEPVEDFFVNLSNPDGATIGDGQGRGTIRDDDAGGQLSPDSQAGDQHDDKGGKKKETEERRQQRERTNASNRDDYTAEGDVIEVHQDEATPSVLIANRDGIMRVVLLCGDRCPRIQVGDYLEADGEKQNEGLFLADAVSVRHRR